MGSHFNSSLSPPGRVVYGQVEQMNPTLIQDIRNLCESNSLGVFFEFDGQLWITTYYNQSHRDQVRATGQSDDLYESAARATQELICGILKSGYESLAKELH